MATLVPVCLLLSNCGPKAPSGQVVARVNGAEITRHELAAEPAVAEMASGGDIDPALHLVLESVINRKIAADQARKLKLDQTPAYIAEQQRLSEDILRRALIEQWASEAPQPAPATISTFIAGHPLVFADRRQLVLDRVITNAGGLDLKALEPLTTMAEIVGFLNRNRHQYHRGEMKADTADLDQAMVTQLLRLPPGDALVVNEDPILQILAVTQTQPISSTSESQVTMATEILRRQAAARRLMAARTSADVVYSLEFSPTTAKVANKVASGSQ